MTVNWKIQPDCRLHLLIKLKITNNKTNNLIAVVVGQYRQRQFSFTDFLWMLSENSAKWAGFKPNLSRILRKPPAAEKITASRIWAEFLAKPAAN